MIFVRPRNEKLRSCFTCRNKSFIAHASWFLLNVPAIVDTMLLIYYVLDYGIIGVFMRSKGMDEPLWYRVSFPYILHPLKWICMSASIFMVVAISAERHRAICSPLTHRPTFWPYAVVVFFVASKYEF